MSDINKKDGRRLRISKIEEKLLLYMRENGHPPPEFEINSEIEEGRLKRKLRMKTKSFNLVASLLEAERKKNTLLTSISKSDTVESIKIDLPKYDGDTESIAVAAFSDVHIDEIVEPDVVNDKNEFNIEIGRERCSKFFSDLLKIINIERAGTSVKVLVLALLGDFISGYIHEELEETNSVTPTEAIFVIKDIIESGIRFLLKYGDFERIIIPCCVGNHSRTTWRYRTSSGEKNSFEYMLYRILEDVFKDEETIEFNISGGYLNILSIDDWYKIRFHHGHAIRYMGGMGGIFAPVNISVLNWNKVETVDLDVFGHFHNVLDGGHWVSNGSVIGYTGYGVYKRLGASIPHQMLTFINKKYGRTALWRINL